MLLAWRGYQSKHNQGGEGSTSTVCPDSTVSMSSDHPVSANMFDQDISRHPWALKQMFRNRPSATNPNLDELSLLLEWQECEPVDLDAK
jgi:hypothetical protein